MYNQHNIPDKSYLKGLKGESLFFEIYSDAIKAPDKVDYEQKIDAFLNGKSVAIKATYNQRYNSFWVETANLSGFGPDAWLNHDVDMVAFIDDINMEVIMVSATTLRSVIDNGDFFTMTNYRRKNGKMVHYRIKSIPKEVLKNETMVRGKLE